MKVPDRLVRPFITLFVALAIGVLVVIALIGMGGEKRQDECAASGGVKTFSHYIFIPVTMPNGSGGATATMTPIPQYACEVAR